MPIRKYTSAKSFAAEALRHFNELKGSLRAARASLAAISRSIRVPQIRQPRGTIPGSTGGGLSFLAGFAATALGATLAEEIDPLGDNGQNFSGTIGGQKISTSFKDGNLTNFQLSGGQQAAKLLDAVLRGQRNR